MSGLIKTQDGSYTLEHSELDATYHSTHGALTESQVVFIQNGLDYLRGQGHEEIQILEIGFGSGLNALLTLLSTLEFEINVDYTGIELYPVDVETLTKLNYTTLLDAPKEVKEAFIGLHVDQKVDVHKAGAIFTGRVLHTDFADVQLPNDQYDLIYFDAFGPGVQPNLWDEEMAKRMYSTLRPDGVLTTYCVQGAWRRHLKSQGFNVSKLPGPPGKREVMRAVK